MTTISENQTNLIDEMNLGKIDKKKANPNARRLLWIMFIFFNVFATCIVIPGIILLSISSKECGSRCTLGEAPCEIDQCHCVPRRTPEFCEDPHIFNSSEGLAGFLLIIDGGGLLIAVIIVWITVGLCVCFSQKKPKEENSEENFKPDSLELKGDCGRFKDEEELPVADD